MTCPDCKGEKITIADHVRYADGTSGYGVTMPCLRCKGAGEVDDRTPEWIVAGNAMRDARVNRGYRTLRDEAKRRGMDVVTLSKMERGVIEPVPDLGGGTQAPG